MVNRPKRSLGQNFLVDPNLQRKIVAALGATPDDEVLEIGPGRGALTGHLVGSVRRLVLIELDDALAASLAERHRDRDDVIVVHGDVLDVPREAHLLEPEAALVVGNIPYNITTPIVFRLLERPRPRDILLMVQDEVAERIVAPAGSKAYGALSVGVQSVAAAKRLFKVGRAAFRTVPNVDSAVVRITPTRPERLDRTGEDGLRSLVRAVFQWRRKQIGGTLRDHPDLGYDESGVSAALQEAGAEWRDRPERLTTEQFVRLATALRGT